MTASETRAVLSKIGMYFSFGKRSKPVMERSMQAAAIVFSEYWMETVVRTLHMREQKESDESFANRHAYCNGFSGTTWERGRRSTGEFGADGKNGIEGLLDDQIKREDVQNDSFRQEHLHFYILESSENDRSTFTCAASTSRMFFTMK